MVADEEIGEPHHRRIAGVKQLAKAVVCLNDLSGPVLGRGVLQWHGGHIFLHAQRRSPVDSLVEKKSRAWWRVAGSRRLEAEVLESNLTSSRPDPGAVDTFSMADVREAS
jgi:hypothetical protein